MSKNQSSSDAWYCLKGNDQDVVLSSRSMLCRNLANFPFPEILNNSESERIQAIVFDAFNYLKNSSEFHTVAVKLLDDTGSKIMSERGILLPYEGKEAGIILRNDGKVSCTVNTDDHVHISSFCSGFNIDHTTNSVYEIDCELQKHIQFAASYDFGYLTSNILNSGSGLVLSAKLHLPFTSMMNKINYLATEVIGGDFTLTATYGPGSRGSSLGSYYTISNSASVAGTEFDQIASMQCALQNIVREERINREKCKIEKKSIIIDNAYKGLAFVNSALFAEKKEAVEIVSRVKTGIDLGFLKGTDDSVLHALLFRIQEGHLEYVLDNGSFSFEDDVKNDKGLMTDRLRALILQEALENVTK